MFGDLCQYLFYKIYRINQNNIFRGRYKKSPQDIIAQNWEWKSPYLLDRRTIIILDCEFIMTPRILFNDRNLSKTDCSVLGLIISLTLKNGYCYASNEYLANYVKVSKRTISDSLSKIKRLKYIIVKYENNNRRIYLNNEKIPTKVANQVAKN